NSEIAHQTTKHTPAEPTQQAPPEHAHLLLRCSQPLSTNQTPHPTTKDGATTKSYPRFPMRDEEIAGLLPQSPIVCLAIVAGSKKPLAPDTFVGGAHAHLRHAG